MCAADVFNFDVDGDDPLNSGTESSALLSPKASVVLGPWSGTEFYVNAGSGFHSNDARGSTTTRDPGTGETVEPTTPLVRANGAEFGVRTVRIPKVQTTVAVWWLGIDSELLFIGDAGTTEATRPSRRVGVEWSTYARPRPWLALDADIAISRGEFTDDDPAGDRIPGSVESVIALGASFDEQPAGLWQRAPSSLRRALARRRRQRPFAGHDPDQRSRPESGWAAARASCSTCSTCSTQKPATSTTSIPRGCETSLLKVWTTSTRILHFHARPASH